MSALSPFGVLAMTRLVILQENLTTAEPFFAFIQDGDTIADQYRVLQTILIPLSVRDAFEGLLALCRGLEQQPGNFLLTLLRAVWEAGRHL